jgi:tripartite ATP-independent transporter DctP family solute receptor
MAKAGVVAVLAAGAALPLAAKEFRSADVHPDDYPTVLAVRHMGDEIRQRTGGRHTIRVYTGNQAGGEKDTIEQTRVGALDLVRVNVAPMNDICPMTMVPSMPFLFRSREHLRRVLDGPIGDELLRACEAQGFVGLAFYDSGARSLYTVRKPVRKVDDARGLRLRVQQSDLWVSIVHAMGATASPMPYGEVYTALKAGLVDGAENNWPSYETSRHVEVAKYYSLTEHSMAPEMLLMSRKVWDTLTPDEQRIFREAARNSVPVMRRLWDEKERQSRAAAVAAGAQVIEVDRKSFEGAMKPVYDKFIKDPKLKDMVAKIQSLR